MQLCTSLPRSSERGSVGFHPPGRQHPSFPEGAYPLKTPPLEHLRRTLGPAGTAKGYTSVCLFIVAGLTPHPQRQPKLDHSDECCTNVIFIKVLPNTATHPRTHTHISKFPYIFTHTHNHSYL